MNETNARHAAKERVRDIIRTNGLHLDADGRIWSIDEHGSAWMFFADAVEAETVTPVDGEAGTGWVFDSTVWTDSPNCLFMVTIQDGNEVRLVWQGQWKSYNGPYGPPVASAEESYDRLEELQDAAEQAGLWVDAKYRYDAQCKHLFMRGPMLHPIISKAG